MQKKSSSLDSFIAWWSIVRGDAAEAIEQYESGILKLYRDDEDISGRALKEMRKIVANMDAMIDLARREK